MAKEKKDVAENLGSDFFSELMKETEFNFASNDESSKFSDLKVTTPLSVLNCIYGGGLPLRAISEISGLPSSGKSTFLYQCLGNYQREYAEDGIPVIYDMETSMDNDRLRALGVDTSRVLRLPSTNIEDAFSNMFKMLNKVRELKKVKPNVSTFQIYDSISTGGTEKQHTEVEKGNSAYGEGTMMTSMQIPKILKQNLNNVLPYMEEFPSYYGLINQVFTQMQGYTTTVNSGGGYGLKHLCHLRIFFSQPKDDYDKDNGFLVGTISEVKLDKSRFSPKISGIPCYIDVTKGGLIDEVESFVMYLIKEGIRLINVGSWYSFGKFILEDMMLKYPQLSQNAEFCDIINKKYRKDDMSALIKDNENLYIFLQIALIDFIDSIYPMQREKNGNYQKLLISKCSYLA